MCSQLIKNYNCKAPLGLEERTKCGCYPDETFRTDDASLVSVLRGVPEGDMYLFGGLETESATENAEMIERIDVCASGKFYRVATLKSKRARSSVAVVRDKFYTTGGYDDQQRCLDTVEAYSPNTDICEYVAPMNHGRYGHASCEYFGALYVCGGRQGQPSRCCEVLEIGDKKWEFIGELNVARSNFEVVSCGSSIWALGGSTKTSDGSVNVSVGSTEQYDLIKGRWTVSVPMIQSRSLHCAVAYHNLIMVVGGYDTDHNCLSTVEVFDTKTKQFSLIMPMKLPRSSFAATICGNILYCFGGRNSRGEALSSVEYYDIERNEWKMQEGMPDGRYYLNAVTGFNSWGRGRPDVQQNLETPRNACRRLIALVSQRLKVE